MSGNIVLQIIVCIILVGYCAYMLYSSAKLFVDDREAQKAYLQVHPEAVKVNFDKYQSLLMVVMALMCFVFSYFGQELTPDGQMPWMYRTTYFCLGLVFLGLMLEVHIHRVILMTDDGFCYAGKTYRFRMISGTEQKKGIIKNVRLLLANGSDLEMPRKMGEEVREKWLAWKERKKEKRSRRKR